MSGHAKSAALRLFEQVFQRVCAAASVAVLLCAVAGCGGSDGPEIAPVTGVVTLDGEPVVGKYVTFSPIDFVPNTQSSRSSVGITDEEGRYELFYTAQRKGALITKHSVTISTPEDAHPPQRENIPPKYRINTELTAEVKNDDNVLHFQLKSD